MPPGKFEKLHLCLKVNLGAILVIYLSTFDVPVNTDTQNFLKCIICMPIHAG